MKLPKKRWLVVGAAVAVLGAAGYYANAAMHVGAGFAAKVLCSGTYVSGRDPGVVLRDDLAFIPGLRPVVDLVGRGVDVHLGWARARAVHRDGLGSALLAGGKPASSPAPAAPQDRSSIGFPAAAPNPKLEAALDAAFAEPDAAKPTRKTRAAVVLHRGAVAAERYATGFARGMPLLGWSMTKSVLHALVGIRIRQGKLRLEDKALLPEWSEPGDPRGAITVEHLLRMESGLAFDESYFAPTSDVVTMLFRSPDTAAYAAARPLAHPPGTVWSYSSGTSNILSRVLRRSFGGDDQAYLRFPREALFAPAGMSSAVLETDASGTFIGSSFTYATARDWARFGQLYLDDGVTSRGERILPEGWVAHAGTPSKLAPQGGYGAHWWLNAGSPGKPEDREMPSVPADLLIASGFQAQTVIVCPSRKAVLVRLGLTMSEDAWNTETWIREVLAALPAE